MPFRRPHSLFRVRGVEDVVAVRRQHATDHRTQGVLVLDHQDPLAAAARGGAIDGGGDGRHAVDRGEEHRDHRALVRPRDDVDSAAGAARDAVDGGQAEAGALAGRPWW